MAEKYWKYTNFRVLISTTTIVFFKIGAQRHPNMALLVPVLSVFLFSQKFRNIQIWGWWLKIWKYFYEVIAQKYWYKEYLFHNLRVFIFWNGLQIDKVECSDFNYDNSFWKLDCKDSQIKYFWFIIYSSFFFHNFVSKNI